MKARIRWRWFIKEIREVGGSEWFVVLSFSGIILGFFGLIFIGYRLHFLPTGFDIGFQLLPVLDYFSFLNKFGLFTSLILFAIAAVYKPKRIPYSLFYILFIAAVWLNLRVLFTVVTVLGPPVERMYQTPIILDLKSVWQLIGTALNSPKVLFFSGHTGLPVLGFLVFSEIELILELVSRGLRREYPINFKKTIKAYFFSGTKISVKILALPLMFLTIGYFGSDAIGGWLVVITVLWILVFLFRKRTITLPILFLTWSFVMGFTVIVVRGHYTLDVLGAYIMTLGIYAISLVCFVGFIELIEAQKRKRAEVK